MAEPGERSTRRRIPAATFRVPARDFAGPRRAVS